ncbi:GNAT family N-acetyltransferase [Nocardia sp. NPDC088792]|uniref:GNAT family N-acetyltransferase n=1 Tax=Nocardia sp. NPDC088792 TaxID=3364332 RepID=UPI00381D4D00
MSDSAVRVDRAELTDAAELSKVAAATFPMACPPTTTPENMAVFIAEMLSEDRFRDYLTDPSRVVLKAVRDGQIVGYALLNSGEPTHPAVAHVITERPVTELSKLYVLPGFHGDGVSAALMSEAVATARSTGSVAMWLAVNQENVRAQRFYGKQGFARVGIKDFMVGTQLHHDYVMQLRC